jgi:hypothetical protein
VATPKRKPAARKAAPKRVAAARAEKTPEPVIVEYRGLNLAVPPSSEWGSELYYLTVDMQTDGATDELAIRIVKELIGREQFALVREKQREDGLKFVDMQNATIELFNTIFGEFGTSVGESEASAAS